MSRLPFSPRLDGASDWALDSLEDLAPRQLGRLFLQARQHLLEELHQPYFDAVEHYHLDRQLERWITRSDLLACARRGGKVYATLDHYHACLPLPRQVAEMADRRRAVFERYFAQRALDSLQANTTNLLGALAVTCLIPEQWFPRQELEKQIEQQVRQLGRFLQVQVDCQLKLPAGGLRWLAENTGQAVERAQEALDSGQPCLLRMIQSQRQLADNRQVIVYNCRQVGAGCLRLEVFEPDCVLDEHALQVEIKDGKVSVTEIAPPALPRAVLGLLVDAYTPSPPPEACTPWLKRTWWRLRRRGLITR